MRVVKEKRYCIVGDRNPIAAEYTLKTTENGLWVSVKKTERKKL